MTEVANQSGGCQCGKVLYQLRRPRRLAYLCHCAECRKQSASAFAISVPALFSELDLDGTPDAYQRPAASGATTSCYFCGDCGTRLFHRSSGSPEFITLKGGSLDDAHALTIVAQLWTDRRLPWVQLSADIETYATQPDDLAGWRRRILETPDA